jgi:CRP/FNR family cyclic AMP-dependent transcriptional regulator
MSYETEIKEKVERGEKLPNKIDINTLKYFWQSGPFIRSNKHTIPKFLKTIKVFQNFSDYELSVLSKFLHIRNFQNGEVVFTQNDLGMGFYMIYSGHVDVVVEQDHMKQTEDPSEGQVRLVLSLETGDYFGELALLRGNSTRNATVVAKDTCQLLGIFKPDIEELTTKHPIVASRLLQSVSIIIADRLFSLTREVRLLKHKLSQYEPDQNER